MDMNEFFSWSMLGTFAGAVLAVGIITQFVKDAFPKIPTQIVTYIVALLILTLATAATIEEEIGWASWAIIPLNAVLVSIASNGAYSALLRLKGKDE